MKVFISCDSDEDISLIEDYFFNNTNIEIICINKVTFTTSLWLKIEKSIRDCDVFILLNMIKKEKCVPEYKYSDNNNLYDHYIWSPNLIREYTYAFALRKHVIWFVKDALKEYLIHDNKDNRPSLFRGDLYEIYFSDQDIIKHINELYVEEEKKINIEEILDNIQNLLWELRSLFNNYINNCLPHCTTQLIFKNKPLYLKCEEISGLYKNNKIKQEMDATIIGIKIKNEVKKITNRIAKCHALFLQTGQKSFAEKNKEYRKWFNECINIIDVLIDKCRESTPTK